MVQSGINTAGTKAGVSQGISTLCGENIKVLQKQVMPMVVREDYNGYENRYFAKCIGSPWREDFSGYKNRLFVVWVSFLSGEKSEGGFFFAGSWFSGDQINFSEEGHQYHSFFCRPMAAP